MALYKRTPGGSWWIRFTVRGKPVRRSSGTTDRQQAEEYETALRNRFWRQEYLDEKVHTWREAVARYKSEAAWRPSTRRRNLFALRYFERIGSAPIAAITADGVRRAHEAVLREQSPASANRIMAVFRSVLRAAVRWGWITHAPLVPMVHVAEKEPNWVNPEQLAVLVRELPAHLRTPVQFSVLTGLRMSNVRDLTWDRVNLDAGHLWIPSSHYKVRKTHGVTLSAEAVALLKSLPNRSGRVFLYGGKPITGTFNTRAFRNARSRAGLASVRWHDLRHTFASWLASGGASDRVLQSLGGWSSPRMVARYAHLRPSDLRPYVDSVGTIMGTALSQIAVSESAQVTDQQVVPGRGVEPPTRALRMRRGMK